MTMAHEVCMGTTLEMARYAWGQTHPNPMVGAVIVEDGEIASVGYHAAAGKAHAEVAALKALKRKPKPGGVLYVTLEPCSTNGRTGPCTQAIIECGIRHVVVGTVDPNPAHAGKGLKLLEDAGIQVTSGILEDECRDLNLIFNHAITTGRPLIAGKMATTLDGKVSTRDGDSKWITGEAARADVHRWRRLFPAIACGSGTVKSDNPSLTVREEGQPEWCPRRFIFDRSLLSLDDFSAKVYSDAFIENTTVVAWPQSSPERIGKLKNHGISVWQLTANSEEAFFEEFEQRCVADGINGVLIEGGPTLLSAMLAVRKLDYLFAYRAPKLFADDDAGACFNGQAPETLSRAISLHTVKHANLGDDQLLRGYLKYPS